MSILIASTTISVLHQSDDVDAYERGSDITYSVVLSGIRAAILPNKSAQHLPEGHSVTETARMLADPISLTDGDRVLDETTGLTYEVEDSITDVGMLIPVTRATLVRVRGSE